MGSTRGEHSSGYSKVDGTTATLYIDYTIEGMINGTNKIVGKGVITSTTKLACMK